MSELEAWVLYVLVIMVPFLLIIVVPWAARKDYEDLPFIKFARERRRELNERR
jgi:hypothetical protein